MGKLVHTCLGSSYVINDDDPSFIVLTETKFSFHCIGLVCLSHTSEREGEGYCVKGGWREGEERVRRSVNPIPNPDPNPTQATQMSLKEA